MIIGLIDVDGHNFPNLPLMKISAWHKARGDTVEWCIPICHYDKVYVSKVFGDEYSTYTNYLINADEVVFGGTGFAITVENGKEVYHKDRDKDLPYEIEHCYPDYSLYPELTKDTAYGFLTRGCCNNCSFCVVSKKEGLCSVKVADLTEFWKGQKKIKLLDANLLACRERMDLLQQLVDSKAEVDFTQGLDARFITEEVAYKLNEIKTDITHFAFDFMHNKDRILQGLKTFQRICNKESRAVVVYMLTNYDTNFEQDMERVALIQEAKCIPDVRIYRKPTAPKLLRHLQRWCNNRYLYNSCNFYDYKPTNKKTIQEMLDCGELTIY